MNHLKCVLCGKAAITAAAHIPVCGYHFGQYQAEGKKYLPYYERVIFHKLCAAEMRKTTTEGK